MKYIKRFFCFLYGAGIVASGIYINYLFATEYQEQLMQIPQNWLEIESLLLIAAINFSLVGMILIYFIFEKKYESFPKKIGAIVCRMFHIVIAVVISVPLYACVFFWLCYREFIKDDFSMEELYSDMQEGTRKLSFRTEGIEFFCCILQITFILVNIVLLSKIWEGKSIKRSLKKGFLIFRRMARYMNLLIMQVTTFLLSWAVLLVPRHRGPVRISYSLLLMETISDSVLIIIAVYLIFKIVQLFVWHCRWEDKYCIDLCKKGVAPNIETVEKP